MMDRFILCALMMAALLSAKAANADIREGYYYPPVETSEVFDRRINNPPPATRSVRTSFITQITMAQLAAPETPRFAIFAKGQDAEHMIIVGLDNDVFATLFRARAVLAQLTANARGTDFFRKNNLQVVATWFDLAKMLGFEDIVISDGVGWSHRVVLR